MKTVGLEVELKLNLPSSREETNQAVGVTIGGAGLGLAGGGLWRTRNYRHFFCLVFPHAARNAMPPGLPKEVQTVSDGNLCGNVNS